MTGAIRIACAAVCAALAASSAGCMQRRMTVVSNPPGATAYVDGIEIGKTPVSHDFLYYGTREIRLVRDGYDTLTVMQPMSAPWYQIPPLDFVSDNMAFGEIRDERVYRYDLQPVTPVSFEALVEQGNALRRGSVPPPAVPVTGAPPAGPIVIGPAPPAGAPVIPPATTGFPAPGKPRRPWPTPD